MRTGWSEIARQALSLPVLVAAFLLVVTPFGLYLADLPFIANMMFLSLMYAIAAMAWNLLMGYTGQLSIGHAVFFGVGAYTTMILVVYYDVTPWIGMFVAGAVAALVGLGLGVPFFRLRSHWFTLATIAAGEIFKLVFNNWEYVGSSAGLQMKIVPEGKALYYLQYAASYVYIYVALLVLAIELVVLYRIVTSREGFYLQAIREDELAAKTLGINTFKYKMMAMGISAFFTGMAGALYAVRYHFVEPAAVFDVITVSTYIAVAGIIGGIYHFAGPIIGSFIFLPAAEYVRVTIVARFPRLFGLHVFVLGVVLLVVSLFAPDGILGWMEKRGYIRRRRVIEV